jgi:hypothetical protein
MPGRRRSDLIFDHRHNAEISISFSRIFMRRLAYSLTVRSAGSGFLSDYLAALLALLVGNQIAEYSRSIGRVLATICPRRISGSGVIFCVPSRIGFQPGFSAVRCGNWSRFRWCDERRCRRCAALGRGRDPSDGQHLQLLPAFVGTVLLRIVAEMAMGI